MPDTTVPPADELRDAIRDHAARSGLSSDALALLAGVSPDAVRRYFAGRAALNSRHASALCRALGLALAPQPTSAPANTPSR